MKKAKLLIAALAVFMALATIMGVMSCEATPAGPAYEIVWYVIGNGAQPDQQLVQDEINKYLASKNFGATLKLVPYDWGSYDQKMQQIIATGQEFDICFTANWTNNYRLNATRGAFLDITDLVRKHAPKTVAMLGESFLNGSAINGRNFAIPANKEKAHNWGFIIRKDLAEKYNMDLSTIKTFTDIEPFLKTIKDNEPLVYPLEAATGESPRLALDWDKLADDDVPVALYPDNRSGKVMFELEAPETVALFEAMHKFYKAGYIRKDAATVSDFNADEKAGKIFAAIKSLKPGKDAEMTIGTGQPWVQVEITPPVMSNRETTGSLQAISRTSKNPQKALEFIELFSTDPYLNNLVVYGIPGKHVDMVSDNVIKAGADNNLYNNPQGWMYGNQFINYLYESENPKKWQLFEEYNAAALPLMSLGFVFDITPVKNEISAVKNVWKEFLPGLETGTVNPATELPKAIEKFKAAGVDKIIAEAQQQYDAWLAANNKKY
jgi:putative aldouronate transport system substrate-binding protein